MVPHGSNRYSRQWFEFFHAGIDEARTIRETEFICSCARLPGFRKVLDACCGTGRHTRALSNRGYAVTGVDRDANAIAKAREIGGGPNYIVADIRSYQSELGVFDMTIVMGQSFGHFDAAINRDVLRSLGAGVRERGRIVLDLWNPDFSLRIRASENSRRFMGSFTKTSASKAIGYSYNSIIQIAVVNSLNGKCLRRPKWKSWRNPWG